jgi:hypothetical protein
MNPEALLEYLISTGQVSREEFDSLVSTYKESSPVNKLIINAKTADEKYQEVFNNPDSTLDELKLAKINQLDEACSLAIVSGFEHALNTKNYLFSCSLSAQANFQGTDTLFKDGTITQAEWTVVDIATNKVERIILSQSEFNSIKLKVFQHINSNVSKLRNTLEPQVESATAKAEVEAVVW